jgi:hypothetical protein
MSICALYPTPEKVETGSNIERLFQRFPTPAIHDGYNILFAQTIEELTNGEMSEDSPLVIEETFVDDNGVLLDDEAIALSLAKLLFEPDRPVIYGNLGVFVALYNHPAWRLWCGKYEDKDDLEADHESFFGVGVDRRKSLESLKEQARAELKAFLLGSEFDA